MKTSRSFYLKEVSFSILIALLLCVKVQWIPLELQDALLPQKAIGLSPATGFTNWGSNEMLLSAEWKAGTEPGLCYKRFPQTTNWIKTRASKFLFSPLCLMCNHVTDKVHYSQQVARRIESGNAWSEHFDWAIRQSSQIELNLIRDDW